MEQLFLENPYYDDAPVSNPDASEAMSIAADLRREGYDASSALRQAWAEVKGEDNPGESNPIGGLIEAVNPFEAEGFGEILVMAAIGYAIWAGIKRSWTPWTAAPIGHKMLGRPAPRPAPRPSVRWGRCAALRAAVQGSCGPLRRS